MSEPADKNEAKSEEPTYTPKPGGADPKATRLLQELKHDRGVLACRFDAEGRFVFAGAQDYLVHRWNLQLAAEEAAKATAAAKAAAAAKKDKQDKKAAKPEETKPADDPSKSELVGHESWVRAMSLLPDGKRLATGDYVGRVIVWSDIDGEPKTDLSFPAHIGSVRAVSVSPDGKLLASVGNDNMVRVWSVADGKKVLELVGHDCHVYNTAFHPDGKSLVSADLKGIVKHWEIPSGKLVREIDASPLYMYSVKYTVDVGGVRGISFNADGSQLACTGAIGVKGIAHSGNACVLLFDWKSGKMIRQFHPKKTEIATAWGVRFHPDGFIIGSGGSRTGGFLWFWHPDWETEFHLFRFKTRGPGFDVDLSPDGKTLAVAHYDGAVRVYAMFPEEKPDKPDGKPAK